MIIYFCSGKSKNESVYWGEGWHADCGGGDGEQVRAFLVRPQGNMMGTPPLTSCLQMMR